MFTYLLCKHTVALTGRRAALVTAGLDASQQRVLIGRPVYRLTTL